MIMTAIPHESGYKVILSGCMKADKKSYAKGYYTGTLDITPTEARILAYQLLSAAEQCYAAKL